MLELDDNNNLVDFIKLCKGILYGVHKSKIRRLYRLEEDAEKAPIKSSSARLSQRECLEEKIK